MASIKHLDTTNTFNKNVNYTLSPPLQIEDDISDDFTNGFNAGRFFKENGNEPTVVSGQLRMGTIAQKYTSVITYRSFNLIDKSVSIDYVIKGTGANAENYLQFTNDGGGSFWAYEAGGSLLAAIFNVDGSLATPYYQQVANVAGFRLRATENGANGILHIDFKIGGVWVNKKSYSEQDWRPSSGFLSIVAGAYGGGTNTGARYDNLVYSGDDVTPPPLPPIESREIVKTSGGDGWNSYIFSKFYLNTPQIDQSVRAEAQGIGYRGFGFVNLNDGYNPDFVGYSAKSVVFYFNQDGNIDLWENGAQVNPALSTWTAGNELRIQLIEETGVLKCKYWKRAGKKSNEQLLAISGLTDAQLRAMFPVVYKASFYGDGTKFKNCSIEQNGAGDQFLLFDPQIESGFIKFNTEIALMVTESRPLAEGGAGGGGPESMQYIYDGANIAEPTEGLAYMRASGQPIKEIRIWTNTPNLFGEAVFNVRLNGVAMMNGAARPTISSGENFINLTGLNFPTALGDVITLLLEEMPAGGVIATPIVFEVKY